jgi:acyl-CoA reductase-like NAD-dependent aldehyde dehydrogenase
MQLAAQSNLNKVGLECGGKSPNIVLADAPDLDKAATAAAFAIFFNQGEMCSAGSRLLVQESVKDQLLEKIAAVGRSMQPGDPLDPATDIGPVVSERQRQRILGYIDAGTADGAKLVAGGAIPKDQPRGWFVEPTVFADVDNTSVIAREEIFGPVLSLIAYDDVDHAIRLANDSEYGLGGTVWTTDPDRGAAVARRVQTGTIGVNRYIPDPAAPFGGVKASGLGREFGPESLASYQQYQTIYR